QIDLWKALKECLKAPAPADAPLRPPDAASAPTEQSLHILIAEDDRVNQRLIQRVVEAQGHQITRCTDGNAAVDAFEIGKFDLILMHVRRPHPDGFQPTR